MGATRGFEQLAERPYADVLIIGGGINGLATFRDLALQGVDVAVVERGDFVSGASAASSHMIHGGVRYLENGEFRLVHEAVTERNALLRTAPHYVRPLQTTIPIFTTFSGLLSAPLRFLRHGAGKPRERGAALIKIGLVIYDSFSRGGGFFGKASTPRHTFHGRRRSLAQLPQLNPDVKYTATYWDASLHDPERLALDVLRDGRAAGGDRARAANYTEAAGVRDGRVVLRDAETGAETAFTASVVVNASGPWTDLTNLALGDPTAYMGGTKGSHIVLDHPELLAATGGRELFFENEDGRIVLIYPLKGRVLVGTTDLEHDMADPIVCTEEEVEYFIDELAVIPERNLNARVQVPRGLRANYEKNLKNSIPTADYVRWVIGYDRNFFVPWLNPTNSVLLVMSYNSSFNLSEKGGKDYRNAFTKPGHTQTRNGSRFSRLPASAMPTPIGAPGPASRSPRRPTAGRAPGDPGDGCRSGGRS